MEPNTSKWRDKACHPGLVIHLHLDDVNLTSQKKDGSLKYLMS